MAAPGLQRQVIESSASSQEHRVGEGGTRVSPCEKHLQTCLSQSPRLLPGTPVQAAFCRETGLGLCRSSAHRHLVRAVGTPLPALSRGSLSHPGQRATGESTVGPCGAGMWRGGWEFCSEPGTPVSTWPASSGQAHAGRSAVP